MKYRTMNDLMRVWMRKPPSDFHPVIINMPTKVVGHPPGYPDLKIQVRVEITEVEGITPEKVESAIREAVCIVLTRGTYAIQRAVDAGHLADISHLFTVHSP